MFPVLIGLVFLYWAARAVRTHRDAVRRFERAALTGLLGATLWFVSIGGIVAAVLVWLWILP